MTDKQSYATTLTYNAKHGEAVIPDEETLAFDYNFIRNKVLEEAMLKQAQFLGHPIDGKPASGACVRYYSCPMISKLHKIKPKKGLSWII